MVMNFSVFNLIFIISMLSFAKASRSDSPTYTVGVIGFTPALEKTPQMTFKKNFNGYQDVMRQYANKKNIDIIIFPESTLNEEETAIYIPNPDSNKVLCNKTNTDQSILSLLACLSSNFKTYIVYNIVEKVDCNLETQKQLNDKRPCAKNGLNLYNTNIVFDRNGTLISRYRKWNLYNEYTLNTTNVPEVATFQTDFGVKFASVICFDLFWYTPTLSLVQKGYTNFVHPTWWYSNLPFYTANQYLQGWAYATNVNLLSSGGNYASDGATGSGVFHGKQGAIISEMTSKPTNKMFIAEIPKSDKDVNSTIVENKPQNSHHPKRLYNLTLDRDEKVDEYENVLLNSTALNVTEKICHNKLCCEFNITRKLFNFQPNTKYYTYRLIAYSGDKHFPQSPQIKWIRTCAIIACLDDKNIKSCGRIFADDVVYSNLHSFESIEIKANFIKNKNVLIMPNSLEASMQTLSVNNFNLTSTENGKMINSVLKLTNPASDLITFGIYADYYNGFANASSKNSLCISLVVFTLLIFIFNKYIA